MGRLNLLMGTLTAQDHKRALEQSQRNQEAEANAVRTNVWGSDGGGGESEDDEMGDQIVLGDLKTYNTTTPPSPPKPESSLGKTLAGIGLAAAGIGAGAALPIAAYQLLKPDTTNVVVQPTNPVVGVDTDTKYGLKIFRDGAE